MIIMELKVESSDNDYNNDDEINTEQETGPDLLHQLFDLIVMLCHLLVDPLPDPRLITSYPLVLPSIKC